MKNITLTLFAILISFASFGQVAAVTGPTAICQYLYTSYSDATPGGTWSTSNPTVASINATTGVLIGVSAGTANVTYGTAAGTSILAITVNVIPAPITGAGAVCAGSTYTLSDATLGGTWTSTIPGAPIDPITGVLTTGAAYSSGGIYYTLSTGCQRSTTTTVQPSVCASTGPIATNNYLGCSMDSLMVTYFPCGTSYQWQVSPDNITWTNIAGAYSYSYIFTPSTAAYYRCALTCISGGSITYSTPAFVGVPGLSLLSSINILPDTACASLSLSIQACAPSGTYHVVTYFGDGTSTSTTLGAYPYMMGTVTHIYELGGTYTIKEVLYSGSSTVPIDSTTFSYEYLHCRSLPIKLYNDNNSNCALDAGDTYNFVPMSIEIDSNGVVLDTVSATSGLYYKAFGPAGTIYAFKLLPSIGHYSSCPASAIIYDTIQPYTNVYTEKSFALSCSAAGFDLAEHASILCGRHVAYGTIVASNLDCTPQTATVTMNFSPKYIFNNSSPAPTSTTATSATWTISGLSSAVPTIISFTLTVPTPLIPSTWLTPGDTINTSYSISPTSGDADITNNSSIRVDTVTASYDPNYIQATPSGYILPGAAVQYAIHFENTGNAPAHNISVMDTLSDNMDPNSLEIVTATAAMNIAIINDGIHNIAKFDFPNIMLLDSSHHGQCDGAVVFNLKQRAGLADGTMIPAHAGIFFDDNAAVQTDTATNIIATINGADSMCIGTTNTLTELAQGGSWSASNTTASVLNGVVTSATAGTDTISYTQVYLNGPVTVTKVIAIGTFFPPDAGTITGPVNVCIGATISLTDGTASGSWTASNGNATVMNGTVTGVTVGTTMISYTVSNSCGSTSATQGVIVNPMPDAGIISGNDSVCVGLPLTLTENTLGGTWSVYNANASVAAGVVTGVAPGADSIYYTVTNLCGSKTTAKAVFIKICPDGVSEISSADNLSMYPNPTTGELTIQVANGSYSTFTITNEVGQVLLQQKMSNNRTQINIKDYPAGIYYISLKGDNGNVIRKLVKQ